MAELGAGSAQHARWAARRAVTSSVTSCTRRFLRSADAHAGDDVACFHVRLARRLGESERLPPEDRPESREAPVGSGLAAIEMARTRRN